MLLYYIIITLPTMQNSTSHYCKHSELRYCCLCFSSSLMTQPKHKRMHNNYILIIIHKLFNY